MTDARVAPHGAWESPITADAIVTGAIGLGGIAPDGDELCWMEGRPEEGGRSVIVRRAADGTVADVLPAPFNARTRVHEYGGGSMLVAEGVVWFSNFEDQRIWRIDRGGEPAPLTPEGPWRYADAVLDADRGRLICVREDHGGERDEPANEIVAVDLASGESSVLATGHDFYASARLSPDGARLCWLSWDHPNMPWDGTTLSVADVAADGSLGEARVVAGGEAESIFQPGWTPDGDLIFVGDRTGWWNLHRFRDGRVDALCPQRAEFGKPQWMFGMTAWAVESARRLVVSWSERGVARLGTLDPESGALAALDLPYTVFGSVSAADGRAVVLAASATEPPRIVEIDLGTGDASVVRRSVDLDLDEGLISAAEPVEFPTEGGLTAHGYLYRPRNRDFEGPPRERPPLLVKSHGGPTSATGPALDLSIQFWTSRGFAVLDVNYGGSTGYGREYRERLKGNWGVVDVDDCANGARWLAERGEVDGDRLAIRGGSAGGYTTLAALAFRDVFHAGASYYGVSDLGALARETHKFESRYTFGLVAPWPEGKDVYDARSPVFHVEGLSCPVIFFQGLEDRVVPPNQAERMVDALREKGIPVAYVPFEGEQHGFRRSENIRRALEAELWFYGRIFGFEPADRIEPVPIENLREDPTAG